MTAYERPTISASRLKTVGGEKGSPGCERKLAAHYLFNLKQASSPALEFGSALHALAEHWQATGEVIDPESDVAAVFSAGAHLLPTAGATLIEYEHRGELPDGSPYVAYLDAHSADGTPGTRTVVVQDIKTTSNPKYALTGDTDENTGPYALRKDIQVMFYEWILLCAAPHWFAPPCEYGPRHWQWWDPTERNAGMGRARWVYFLTKGVPRAWETNDFITPAMAAAFMADTIMPLVAKINALHEWHHAHPHATLDEIDRNPAACKDFRGHYGRWCGAGEQEACNYDRLGTPVLDLVQLKVRKMTTPQERMIALREKNAAARAAAGGAPPAAAAPPPPAPVQEAPAASPPPAAPPAPTPPTAPTAPSQEAPTFTPAADVAPASDSNPTAGPGVAVASPAGDLTRGQRAAATRAANRAKVAAPAGAGINPPEVTEALAAAPAPAVAEELTAPRPAPAAPVAATGLSIPVAVVTLVGIEEITKFLVAQGYAVTKAVAS